MLLCLPHVLPPTVQSSSPRGRNAVIIFACYRQWPKDIHFFSPSSQQQWLLPAPFLPLSLPLFPILSQITINFATAKEATQRQSGGSSRQPHKKMPAASGEEALARSLQQKVACRAAAAGALIPSFLLDFCRDANGLVSLTGISPSAF